MLRGSVICIILLTMQLHCACRLGLLSSLYAQRYDIAFCIGIIDEKPIAVCSSAYDGEHRLAIQELPDGDENLPIDFSQAKEINLFAPCQLLRIDYSDEGQPIIRTDRYTESSYTSPPDPIFKPPSAA